MEVTSRRMMMCDMDVGVDIDLVDPSTYRVKSDAPLTVLADPIYVLTVVTGGFERRGVIARRKRPITFETEKVSSACSGCTLHEENRIHISRIQPLWFGSRQVLPFTKSYFYFRQEIKVGYNLLKNLNPDDIFYRDRERQVGASNRTFENITKPATQHPHKPEVIAVEELPVFPDFEVSRSFPSYLI